MTTSTDRTFRSFKNVSLCGSSNTRSQQCAGISWPYNQALPQLRASLSQTYKRPLLFFILRRIRNLNSRFYSALLDIKNHHITSTDTSHITFGTAIHTTVATASVTKTGSTTIKDTA
eukprot:g26942.t1